MVLDKFRPNLQVDSLSAINLDDLKRQGIKAIVVDIDNTLVPWDKKVLGPESRDWVSMTMRKGFQVAIVSNGRKERVSGMAEELGVPGFAKAVKPRKSGFQKALKVFGTSPVETAIVGDQLFTDVLGGNRTGMFTIWMTPLSDKELLATKFMRRLEKRIVRRLQKKGMLVLGTNESEEDVG